MMGFRDMTFCTFRGCKNFGEACRRSYTEKVHKDATAWWGSTDYPIVLYAGEPFCYEEKSSDTKQTQTNE